MNPEEMHASPLKPDEQRDQPRSVNDLLGYPSATLSLEPIHYPVNMTRETLEGQVLEGPIEFKEKSTLEAFCKEGDKKLEKGVEGYWRVKSL